MSDIEKKERIKQSKREYYRKNREKLLEKKRAERRRNKEEYNRRMREYRTRHKEKINKKARNRRRKRRLEVIEKFGSKCMICGFDDWRGLQIDHKESDGHEERKKGLRGESFLVMLLETSMKELNKRYQLLCANCNQIKKYINNEW